MTKPESQDHLACLYNRQEQLDSIEVNWMRRTLGSVSLTGDDWRLRKQGVPTEGAAMSAGGSMNQHQLRQLERDRQIRERRERRNREQLAGSELAGTSPPEQHQHQQQQQEQQRLPFTSTTDLLAVKRMTNAGTDGRMNGSSGGDAVGAQSKSQPLLQPHQQQGGRGKRMPLMHPAALPPLLGQLQHHQSEGKSSSDRRSPRQAVLARQQLRRFGGHHQLRQQRTSQGDTSADLQFLRIAGPAAHGVRWPTPIEPLQSDRQRAAHRHEVTLLNKELTLVTPRNPENSPEPID